MSELISKKVGIKKVVVNVFCFICVILWMIKLGLKVFFVFVNKIFKFLYKYNVISRNIKIFMILESEIFIFLCINFLWSIYNIVSMINKIKVFLILIFFSVLKIVVLIKDIIVI